MLIFEDEVHALTYQVCSRFIIILDIPSWKISLACVHHAAWLSVLFASLDDSLRSVAMLLREGHLKEHIAVCEKAKVVYSARFFVTVSPGSIEIASSHCSEQGKTYGMSPSAPLIIQVSPFKAVLMKTMPNVDVLFGNMIEAATFAETEAWEVKDFAS